MKTRMVLGTVFMIASSSAFAASSLQARAQKAQIELNSILYSAGITNTVNFHPCRDEFRQSLQHIQADELKNLDRVFCLSMNVRSLNEKNKVKHNLGIQEDTFTSGGFLVTIRVR